MNERESGRIRERETSGWEWREIVSEFLRDSWEESGLKNKDSKERGEKSEQRGHTEVGEEEREW